MTDLTAGFTDDIHPALLIAHVVVDGEPVPKQRPRVRAARQGERNRDGSPTKGRAYTPTRTAQAEELVGWLFRKAVGPGYHPSARHTFGVKARFHCARGSGGDVDNMSKLILDAVTAAGGWADDRLVHRLDAEIVPWSPQPRTEFAVWRYQLLERRAS